MWHIIIFIILFVTLMLQEWKIQKMNKRIYSQQELIDLIHQVALDYLYNELRDGSLKLEDIEKN